MKHPYRSRRVMMFGFYLCLCILTVATPCLAAEDSSATSIQSNTQQFLEQAMADTPNNYAVSFYLGQIYLNEGKRDKAISAWENYLAANPPKNSKRVAVRERVTVMKIQQAAENARNAIKEADAESLKKIPQNTLAVLNFANLGDQKYEPFVKGLTAMVITDLSKVPQLKVVERVQMNALMNEMRLADTGIVDAQSAAKMGRFLMAKNIAWGNVQIPEADYLKIDSVVSDTTNQEEVGKSEAEGPQPKFFELEKQLVYGILTSVGLKKEDLAPEVRNALDKIHTKSFQALMEYGQGLMHLDANDFAQADQSFQSAAETDPEFDLAVEAAADTPGGNIAMGTPIDSGPSPDLVAEEDSDNEPDEVLDNSTADKVDATEEIITAGNETAIQSGPTVRHGYAVIAPSRYDPGGVPSISETAIYQTTDRNDLSSIDGFTAVDSVYGNTMSLSPSATGEQVNNLSVGFTPVAITGGLPYQMTETVLGYNDYLEWGYWAGSTTPPMTEAPPNEYFVDNRAYFIGGDPTADLRMADLATQGLTGSYAGSAYATIWDAAGGINLTGSFGASVDFSSGTITNFNVSATDGGTNTLSILGADGAFLPNSSSFSINPTGTWTVNGLGVNDNVAYGSVYGPNAEHIGGIYSMYYNSTVPATGIFEGTR